jgi:hypothetical protein
MIPKRIARITDVESCVEGRLRALEAAGSNLDNAMG